MFLLCLSCIVANLLSTQAQESGFSAVTETDQDFERYTYRSQMVKNWKHEGRPGLFMNDGFNKTENSIFHIQDGGVYYVSANLILATSGGSSWYYSSHTLYCKIISSNEKGGIYKSITTQVTMEKYDKKTLRVSGYLEVQPGGQIYVTVSGYSYRWERSVKVGSTFSAMRVSKAGMFPGVILHGDYDYVRLDEARKTIESWSEFNEVKNTPKMSEGNFRVPQNGLYHVLVNLNLHRYSSDELIKFSIMINNKTEAVSRTIKVENYMTVVLEGMLNLLENQTISVTGSSSAHVYIRFYSSSMFFIHSRGTLTRSTPGISTHYKSTSSLHADVWSELNQWNTTSTPSLNHYSNVKLKNGEFVSTKEGIYQVTFALYLRNCSTATAKISMKANNSYEAIGPEVGFTKESNYCYLQNTVLLYMDVGDTLKIQVKNDKKYTVSAKTSYQVLYQNSYSLWPAAIFQLTTSFQFNTNTKAVTVHGWSHANEGNWNDAFFNVNKDSVQVATAGLYTISYNLVVKTKSTIQFESQVTVNGIPAIGSKCRRVNTPTIFTCSASTLLNLNGTNNLAVQVKMTDTTKKPVEIQTSSRMTLTFIGDLRSHPTFKFISKPSSTYTTKAGSTDMKTLNDFALPNSSFFQSSAMYSTLEKSFKTGTDNRFFLLNNVQFNLQNEGTVAAVVGSKENNMVAYSKEHKKSKFSIPGSDLSSGSQFYFSVSGEAPTGSALKWQSESAVVSGVYVGNKDSLKSVKARLRPNFKVECSSEWTLVNIKNWKLLMASSGFGIITPNGIQISKGGFYVTSVNFAVTTNNTETVINVGIFADKVMKLSASETSQKGKFSMFLQGVLDLKSQQDIDIKVKCDAPTEITFANGGGIFAFQVDEHQSWPSLRMQFVRYWWSNDDGKLRPSYGSSSSQAFYQDFKYANQEITVTRSGVYLVSVVGSIYAYDDFQLTFASSFCNSDSSPLYFKEVSSDNSKSISLNGFISLVAGDVVYLVRNDSTYYWYYSSNLYMSIQFMGNVDTSSSQTTTLQKDTTFAKGTNQQFGKEKTLSHGKACHTSSNNAQFAKHKASYTGLYAVSMNFVLKLTEDGSDFKYCLTIDGKGIDKGMKDLTPGCFKDRFQNKNTTTVSGSQLVYLQAGNVLSVQITTSKRITVSKRSSFSIFYLGTAGAITGFSSILSKRAPRELPSQSQRSYYRYHWHSYDYQDYVQYVVEGWNSDVKRSEMFFQNKIEGESNKMFVCPKEGVYMFMVKVQVGGTANTNFTCDLKLQLAVGGSLLNVQHKKEFAGSSDTLSITTTLRLEKWDGVTVRFSKKRMGCKNVDITTGSTFSVVYVGRGKEAFTLWPDIGPRIVEFPDSYAVYVREDIAHTTNLTCVAVGKYHITYQWLAYINYYQKVVVGESQVLDTKTLNSSTTQVQCVATMRGLVVETRFTNVHVFDPTVVFSDNYNNRSYDVPEKNSSSTYGYYDVLEFGATFKRSGYYYYYWEKRIECSITKGNMNGTFTIEDKDSYWGYGDDDQFFKLRARKEQLDRETTPDYHIQITCQNLEYTDAEPAVTTIHVVILDANDNLPVFSKEIYTKKISNTVKPGEDLIEVHATDDDAKQNGEIAYSLIYSSDSYIFVIDKWGVISLKDQERLSKPYYRMTVVATDRGTPPRSSYVTVLFEVEDYESTFNRTKDEPPMFTQSIYYAYLIRGTPLGTIVKAVHAYNPNTFDDRGIRYWINNGDSSVFKIDPKTGVIRTIRKFMKKEYHLQIGARYTFKPGEKEHSNLTRVVVLVTDVKKNEPNFVKPHYEVCIPENTRINKPILSVKAVYDKPEGKVEYLLPTDRGIFEINKNTGAITLKRNLDYETTQVHTFVVSVRDAEDIDRDSCTDVTVHVQDVNDNAPVILYPNKPLLVKLERTYSDTTNRTEIGHIIAQDRDNGTNGEIKYYLQDLYDGEHGDAFKHFDIDPDSGTLYIFDNMHCDYDDHDCVHNLTVVAKDQGIPSLSDTAVITVIVQHVGRVKSTPGPHHHEPHHHGTHHHGTHHHAHTAGGSSTNINYYVIPSVVGGVAIIIVIAVIFWARRRRRFQNYATTMNYMSIPSDEDDNLLDVAGSDHGKNDEDNERRLSLISSASDDNLLRNEAPC